MSAAPTATPAAPAEAAEPAPRRGRARLIVVGAVLAILIGGGAAWFLTGGASTDTSSGEDAAAAAAVEEGEILEVGTLTTNLGGDRPAYARVGVALVLAADADPTVVEGDLALVKDAAITEITRHGAEELQGEEGVASLRDGLTAAVGALFEDGEVVRVVLTELLVQ